MNLASTVLREVGLRRNKSTYAQPTRRGDAFNMDNPMNLANTVVRGVGVSRTSAIV